ncbi:copper chaperone PCu(A)C [Paraburkholderia sp.]|uniref:copper chaperone PCu(A)C n=1 Tax=Paraburkholderia sp. TaxID=1926495 RepID=UPI003D6E7215
MNLSMKTLLVATLCGTTVPALAAAPSAMMVSDCWIRALPGNLPSGGYFSAMNMSDKSIDLTGVTSDAFGMAMLHQTQSNGSTSSMAMIDHVAVPAGGTLAFAPGNYHVMLEQPRKPLKVGSTVPLMFMFSDGEKVVAQCAVKNASAMK